MPVSKKKKTEIHTLQDADPGAMLAVAEFLNSRVDVPEVRTMEDCSNLDDASFRYKVAFHAGRRSIVDELLGQLNTMKEQ